MWAQLAVSLVMMVLAYALQPKPPQPVPAWINDVQAPTAQVGISIPVVFGTVKLLAPNVLWYGNLSTTKITAGK
jgi:hypothetical protein